MSSDRDEPMSTGAWFLTLLVLAIPLLNVIMFIVWALGVGNVNRVTFCRATLLWTLIGIALAVLLSLAGLAVLPHARAV